MRYHKKNLEKIAIIAAIIILGIFTGCKQSPDDNPYQDGPPWEGKMVYETWWLERHVSCVQQANSGALDMIFIGDSITYLWEYETGLWDVMTAGYTAANFGFGSDTTRQVIWRLENGEFPDTISPTYVFLLAGTNNSAVAEDSPQDTATAIHKIIEIINSASSGTKIILMSILPRGDNRTANRKNKRVNDIIRTYNGSLNVTYLDVFDDFLNDDGSVNTSLYDWTLVHLSTDGYEILRDKILEVLQP